MNDRPVAIVTGGSRGMGAWVVRWLIKAGAAVVFSARTRKDLAKLEEEIASGGGECLAIEADSSDPEACSLVVNKTLEQFGAIDSLVNNAGVLPPIARVADCDIGKFKQNILINLLGPFYFIRAAAASLRKSGGRVINVSSGAATNPMATWSAYCAAKAGLTHFTRVFAAEEPSITSVSVRPGVVDTDMQALIRREGVKNMPSKLSEYFLGLKEKGALEHPRVPARSIAWLALRAPSELSGKFVEYDDPRIVQPAVDLLGEEP